MPEMLAQARRKTRRTRRRHRKKRSTPTTVTVPFGQSARCRTPADDEEDGDGPRKEDNDLVISFTYHKNKSRSPQTPFSPRITTCSSVSPSLKSAAAAKSRDQPKLLDTLDDIPSSRPISLAFLTAKTHSKNKGTKSWKPFPVDDSESGSSEVDFSCAYSHAVKPMPFPGTPSSVRPMGRPVRVVTTADIENASKIATANRVPSHGPGHHAHQHFADALSYSSPTMPDRSSRRHRSSGIAAHTEVPEVTGPRMMGPDDLSPSKHEEKLSERAMQFNTPAQAAFRVEHYMPDTASHFYQPHPQYGVNPTLGFGYPQGLAIPVVPSPSQAAAQQHADFIMRSRQNGINVQDDFRKAVYGEVTKPGYGVHAGYLPKTSLPKSISTPVLSESQRIGCESSPLKQQVSSEQPSVTSRNLPNSGAHLGLNGSYVNRKVTAPVSSELKTPSNHTVSSDVSPLSKRQTPASEPKITPVPQETLSRVKSQLQPSPNKDGNASQVKLHGNVQSQQNSMAGMTRPSSHVQPEYTSSNGIATAYSTVPHGVAFRPVPWEAISKNTSPPKTGYKFLPPGLPVPPNREKQFSALETLFEDDVPAPGSRLEASSFWFNNEGRDIEVERNENGKTSEGISTLRNQIGLDSKKPLEGDYALWGRLCENIWSYKEEQMAGKDSPFAKFQQAPSCCHEQSYGGKRTFFDTDPLTDTWRLPPKFTVPTENGAAYSYDKGKGKERSTSGRA